MGESLSRSRRFSGKFHKRRSTIIRRRIESDIVEEEEPCELHNIFKCKNCNDSMSQKAIRLLNRSVSQIASSASKKRNSVVSLQKCISETSSYETNTSIIQNSSSGSFDEFLSLFTGKDNSQMSAEAWEGLSNDVKNVYFAQVFQGKTNDKVCKDDYAESNNPFLDQYSLTINSHKNYDRYANYDVTSSTSKPLLSNETRYKLKLENFDKSDDAFNDSNSISPFTEEFFERDAAKFYIEEIKEWNIRNELPQNLKEMLKSLQNRNSTSISSIPITPCNTPTTETGPTQKQLFNPVENVERLTNTLPHEKKESKTVVNQESFKLLTVFSSKSKKLLKKWKRKPQSHLPDTFYEVAKKN